MTTRAAAPTLGTLTGFLLKDHQGLPVWLFIAIVSVSLLFGVLATMGREGKRRVTPRQAAFNGGALWILACSATYLLDLSLATSAILALAIGLLGADALLVIERIGSRTLEGILVRVLGPDNLPPTRGEMDEKIGELRDKTQAAIAERAVKRRREKNDEPHP